LTDSVRCSALSSNHFTCEVEIDSDVDQCEPATPWCESPAPPPTQSSPAVSTLVSSFVSSKVVTLPTPAITLAALKQCASSEIGLVLASLTPKHPLVMGLTMLKAVVDATQCLTAARDAAAERYAQNYCREQGGELSRAGDDHFICEVRQRAK